MNQKFIVYCEQPLKLFVPIVHTFAHVPLLCLIQFQATGTQIHAIDPADWDATRSLLDSLGPIDLLVNNANVSSLSPFLKNDDVDL